MKDQIQVIAFDGDDTLWNNEPYFQAAEEQFIALLESESRLPAAEISARLAATEVENLALYGYGIKGFVLSMIETAQACCGKALMGNLVRQLVGLGKQMLNEPVTLLPDTTKVLKQLGEHYRLVLATKGDLLDQQRKLEKSGLAAHFHHIEVMSNKHEKDYRKILRHLDIAAHQLLMVGNSLKSDVLPVLALGAYAAYIPYHITWHHEQVEVLPKHDQFVQLTRIGELPAFLDAPR